MFAARRGSLPIVKFILQHDGVDVNQANKGGVLYLLVKLLFILLLWGPNSMLCSSFWALKELIQLRKQFTFVFVFWCFILCFRNALHCAARRCKTDIIDLLLNTHQLHPNQQDNKVWLFCWVIRHFTLRFTMRILRQFTDSWMSREWNLIFVTSAEFFFWV